MKIMIANSKVKYKSKAMLGFIRNLVLDFILYFVTAHMRNYPIHAISSQTTAQYTLHIT